MPPKKAPKRKQEVEAEDEENWSNSQLLFNEEFFKSFATSEKQLLKFHLKAKVPEICQLVASDKYSEEKKGT